MILRATGIKAWLLILGVIALILIGLVIFVQVLIFLLPVIVLIIVISYLFRILNKLKKGSQKDYVDINFKVRK